MDTRALRRRPRIERRLRYLRDVELAFVPLTPAMTLLLARDGGDPAGAWTRRAAGAAAVSYVLLQGGTYWHLKLAAVRAGRRALPAWFRAVFAGCWRTNPLVLATAAVWMVASRAAPGAGVSADLFWGLALVAFAGLEHVNYYVRQLMHDTARDVAYLRRYRRLRRPPLRHDLDVLDVAAPPRRSPPAT